MSELTGKTLSKYKVLEKIGAGAASATIGGNQLDRVLHIHSGVAIEINGVKITNGKTPDGVSGGGIYLP